MTIVPIIRRVDTRAAPDCAFEIFMTRMGEWWPRGMTIGAKPHVAVKIEPPDGRWYEVDEDGVECDWGRVLSWDPPRRAVLAWQIGPDFKFDPALATEVEVTFEPRPEGGTTVTLEHRGLERLGAAADRARTSLDGGWPRLLQAFAAHADR